MIRCGPGSGATAGRTNPVVQALLDEIVDTDHALAKLGRAIDWRFLEKRFGAVYSDKTDIRRCRRG